MGFEARQALASRGFVPAGRAVQIPRDSLAEQVLQLAPHALSQKTPSTQYEPQLSPWSATGEVYRYRVRGDAYTLTGLKTAQDWILERQFRQARRSST